MSWLDKIPTGDTNAYVFQAALYCEDCGERLKENLSGAEDTGDSEDYPQGPYEYGGGEADSPQFCDSDRRCVNAVSVAGAKVGLPLGNPLTSDGAREVRRMVLDDLVSPSKFKRMVGRLLCAFWKDYCGGEPAGGPHPDHLHLPKSLVDAVQRYQANHPCTIRPMTMVDAENVYLYAVGPKASVVSLLRCPVEDTGEFKKVEVAEFAPSPATDDARGAIIDAVREMAWD